jgi:zinc D-Ala-D-Ala carboxypeptidase
VPRCGIGRVKNKHAPRRQQSSKTFHPVGPKKIVSERITAEAFGELTTDARKAGLQAPLFLIVSGYRDAARQTELFAKALGKYHTFAEARKWVAPPGHSAHATGCAIDFWFGFPCGKEYNDKIKSSDAYKWMVANAKAHGFNPYGREGWHWEYNVGDPY